MSTDLAGTSFLQLRCFVAVAEARSFAESGRRLGLTTSGVSKSITRLEASAGVRLLHRSTHALSLTEAGERLLAPAREALNSIACADALLAELAVEGSSGRVRLSAPTAFIRACLVPMLPAFLVEHPLVLLDLRATDTTVDLAEAGVDLALRSGPLLGVPGHVGVPWFRFAWVVCASPAYLARRGIPRTSEELRTHDLVGFRNIRTGLVERWRLAGMSSPFPASAWRIVLDDAESAWRAALAGIGIAWAPDWLAAEALGTGSAVELLEHLRHETTSMSILRRKGIHVPARVNTVVTFLKSSTKTLPNWPRTNRSRSDECSFRRQV